MPQDRPLLLSQPLQDLLESGLVDFSRHIDVRLLNQALTMQTNTSSTARQPVGISYLSYASLLPSNQNSALDQLSLEDALQQLSNIEDEPADFENQQQQVASSTLYRKSLSVFKCTIDNSAEEANIE